jgi:hypothetical protein
MAVTDLRFISSLLITCYMFRHADVIRLTPIRLYSLVSKANVFATSVLGRQSTPRVSGAVVQIGGWLSSWS